MSQIREIKIFVSSTFSDMVLERKLLQSRVFPELTELCISYNALFSAVDLRWGINEKQQRDHKTMEICIGEIKRCQRESLRPNFMILLGDRYGWLPAPVSIIESEYCKIYDSLTASDSTLLDSCYVLDENSVQPIYVVNPTIELERWYELEPKLSDVLLRGAHSAGLSDNQVSKYKYSATHQEIIEGLKLFDHEQADEAARHVMATVREITNLGTQNTVYVDRGTDKLSELKTEIVSRLGTARGGRQTSLYRYKAIIDDKMNELKFDEESFVQAVLDHYRPIIIEELSINTSETLLKTSPTKKWNEHHVLSDDIIGRDKELDWCTSDRLPKLCFRVGDGYGVTSLLHVLANEARSRGQSVISFHIERGSSSSGLKQVAIGLIQQLELDTEQGREPLYLFEKIVEAFNETSESSVLILDRLDRLSDSPKKIRRCINRLAKLPVKVKLMITLDPSFDLMSSITCTEKLLSPLCTHTARSILDTWLLKYGRRLQSEQAQNIIERFKVTGDLLALEMMSREASQWGSFYHPTILDHRLTDLATAELAGLMQLHNPSKEGHITPLVERSLELISVTKFGLSESEVIQLLEGDCNFMNSLERSSHHSLSQPKIPAVLKSRLWAELRGILLPSNKFLGDRYLLPLQHREALLSLGRAIDPHDDQLSVLNLLKGYHSKPPSARLILELCHLYGQRSDHSAYESLICSFDTVMIMARSNLTSMLYNVFYDLSNNIGRDQSLVLQSWIHYLETVLPLITISNHPHHEEQICLQLAMEHSDDSPIMKSAESWLEKNPVSFNWAYNVDRETTISSRLSQIKLMGEEGIKRGDGILSWDSHTLYLWDRDGQLEEVIQGHSSSVKSALSLSNGGLISWDETGEIILWSGDFIPVRHLRHQNSKVGGVLELDAYSFLTWGGGFENENYDIIIWTENGLIANKLVGHQATLIDAKIIDGSLVTWGWDQMIKIWNLKSTSEVYSFESHRGNIKGIISIGTNTFLSWSDALTPRLWSIQEGQTAELNGHERWVNQSYMTSSNLILTCSADRSVRLWTIKGELLAKSEYFDDAVQGCIELNDGNFLIWGNGGRIWVLNKSLELLFDEIVDPQGLSNVYSRDHQAIILGHTSLYLFDLQNWKKVKESNFEVKSFAWLDERFLLGQGNSALYRLDLHLMNTVKSTRSRKVSGLVYLSTDHLISWLEGGFIGSPFSKQIETFKAHEDDIIQLCEDSEQTLISTSYDRTIKRFSRNGELIWTCSLEDRLRCFEVIGNWIITVSRKGKFAIITRLHGKVRKLPDEAISEGSNVKYLSPERVAVWDDYGRLQVWDLSAYRVIELNCDNHVVYGLSFLEDDLLLTWSNAKQNQLWLIPSELEREVSLALWSAEGKLMESVTGEAGWTNGAINYKGLIYTWYGSQLTQRKSSLSPMNYFNDHQSDIACAEDRGSDGLLITSKTEVITYRIKGHINVQRILPHLTWLERTVPYSGHFEKPLSIYPISDSEDVIIADESYSLKRLRLMRNGSVKFDFTNKY